MQSKQRLLVNHSHSFAAGLVAIGISGTRVEFDEYTSTCLDNFKESSEVFKADQYVYPINEWCEWICENILEKCIYEKYKCTVGAAVFQFTENGLVVLMSLPSQHDIILIPDCFYF